jgi:hypothetical protein
MNFVTEAKRLHIDPPFGARYNDEWDGGPDRIIPLEGFETDGIREDDLCVDGCFDCREFRATVKAALENEAPWSGLTLEEAFQNGRMLGAHESLLAIRADIIAQHESDIAELDAILDMGEEAIGMWGLEEEVIRPNA